MKTKFNLIGWALLAILFLGCSSSKITSSWKSDSETPAKFNKILVVGLMVEPDRTLREKMELHLVNDLLNHGIYAVSAENEFGPKAFEKLNEKEALQKLEKSGFDAVLTIVLLNKTKEKYYTPGYINNTPYRLHQDQFWNYYLLMRDRIYTEGYYSETTKYFWESNLFNISGKKLLYSVQTQSFDPASAESLAHEYGLLIIGDIVKKEILGNPENPVQKAF